LASWSFPFYSWIVTAPTNRLRKRAVFAAWLLLVLFVATQWCIYDWSHHEAERFAYYLGTSAYFLGFLTPAALWLAFRWPFDARHWKLRLAQHLFASVILTAVGVVIETFILWPMHTGWQFQSALRHCFTYHTQLGLVAYLVLLVGAHAYRWYTRVRERELRTAQLEAQLAEAQLTVLRTQLQPHFLFNTLQAATMSIYDDPEGAEEILLSLSELLRISLQTLQQQEIPLRSEIAFLKHYAAIQQRRFGDRLRFEFVIDKDSESCAVPSLLLQPLVENAVRHGINVRREPDLVSVRTFMTRDCVNIQIKNRSSVLDGPLEDLVSRGVGLSNTIARLERLYGLEQSFNIRNLSPQGVEVSLSIPLQTVPQKIGKLEAQAV
jgi:two-component system, LytTR family, sensor kinase